MSENPLEVAHNRVQERKAACGMPELTDVFDGAEVPNGSDGSGMWSGTDLTEGQVSEAASVLTRAVVTMVARGDVTLPQSYVATYIEGLLVGIEHGRSLGS